MYYFKATLLRVCVVVLLVFSASESHNVTAFKKNSSYNYKLERIWVDSVYNSMTFDERLGQLFMLRAHSNKGVEHEQELERLIKKYNIGGLCFFQGTPQKQVELTNHFQSISKIPLIISMDAEWGLGMRLKETTISFPRQLTFGAIQDNSLLYNMGLEVARQCKRIGVHINFAPVADVNNNPANPVINDRSFGEDRFNVATKSYMYMQGMQDGGLIACAKHFPGHGDTNVDSHYDLPLIIHDKRRLDSIELLPFKILSQQGIASMMVGHLQVSSIDSSPNTPTTLSENAVTNLLKNELAFQGLVITDALDMKGVTKNHRQGEVEARALQAGNDILLLPENVEKALVEIKSFITEGKIDTNLVAKSIKKILAAKYQVGLSNYQPIDSTNLINDLNTYKAEDLKQTLYKNAITLVRNDDELLPIKNVVKYKFASISIGSNTKTVFQQTLSNYAEVTPFNASADMSILQRDQLMDSLKENDVVFVSIHSMNKKSSENFGISSSTKMFIETLRHKTKVVLVVFGNPYSLKFFDEIDYLVESYEDDNAMQSVTAQALFGALEMSGRLPVSASQKSKYGWGDCSSSIGRLKYALPENVQMSSERLKKVDELALQAINDGATPSCAIMVVKNGTVVYDKSFGNFTYDKVHAVEGREIYDLASVTKIIASTASIMHLQEEGQIDIYKPISEFLPALKNTNKANLTLYNIMLHQAGLKAWIPFYEATVGNGKPLPQFYQPVADNKFNVKVCENMYMREDYINDMKNQIYNSELRENKDYKYSDLGFYMIADILKHQTNKTIDVFTQKHFYQPLGMYHTLYQPLQKFPLDQIIPTENDNYFRLTTVQGYVHDMGAAMLGGVSGHAGLFSNTNDLAIFMQMLLNGGYYAGVRYFKEQTVKLFTIRGQGSSRRGIGFDMKELNKSKSQNVSERASIHTFGHLGFTGTCVWADPDEQLIFIFLSNRTYPSMNNNKLNSEDIRPRIQSLVYDAIMK
ncbi:MAG: serine hydrolase [Saprospiraceae bacterium]|nr:serine hydrolase [Saprospiraceae bacterium]